MNDEKIPNVLTAVDLADPNAIIENLRIVKKVA
jgi:hypothetical protein